MSIGSLQTEGDLERFMRNHLQRPEVRKPLAEKIDPGLTPTFATGWSDYGGAYQTATYRKDRDRVYICGSVKNGGTGTGLIFTLPEGYRPTADITFAVTIGAGIFGWVLIASDGTVTDGIFNASSKAALALDPISFSVN